MVCVSTCTLRSSSSTIRRIFFLFSPATTLSHTLADPHSDCVPMDSQWPRATQKNTYFLYSVAVVRRMTLAASRANAEHVVVANLITNSSQNVYCIHNYMTMTTICFPLVRQQHRATMIRVHFRGRIYCSQQPHTVTQVMGQQSHIAI